ncbi:flippase [Niallia circulans]|uniref:flippase n=1 Tax=Niallia circulans TaxID=1397 RepID=UPI0014901BA5|nr:flippase [Niallia circulans]QJX64162.1 flippase [Niallia circulans]
MDKLKVLMKNFILAGSGNIFGQIVSFIILTYLARVLGPDGYGTFNFAQSYLFYFFILTDLGLSLYITKEFNQKNSYENIFSDIFSLRVVLSIFSFFIFIISIFFLEISAYEQKVFIIFGLSILSTGIFIDSFFIAKNDMKYNGMAQLVKNVSYLIICLLLVKDNEDVEYAALAFMVGCTIATFYLIFIFAKKYRLKLSIIPKVNQFKLLKASLPLALSLMMIQINNNFDILYLSFYSDDKDLVGFYSAAYRIISFLISILVIYFSASYPTIANLIENNRIELNKFIENFFKIGIFFITPITIGGIAVSEKLMTFIYGSQFSNSGILFASLLPLLIIRMVTSTYSAVLIMGNKGKELSISLIIGAIINVILNVVMVPKYGGLGSAIATLICELVQGIFLYYYYHKICNANLLKKIFKPLLSSSIMATIIYLLDLNLFVSIIIGVVSYAMVSFVIDYKYFLHLMKIK